jgi:hypothetical protein
MADKLMPLNRRQGLLGAAALLCSLPACSQHEDARREQAGLPPSSDQRQYLRRKFRGMKGGELVVDAFGEKKGVLIVDERGRRFYGRAVVSQRNNSKHAYGAEFGVPISLRATWLRENEEVNGVIQNPIRVTRYDTYEGGVVVGDFTVQVAERIPEDLLDAMRKGVGGFRLKLRLHDDGLLIGWDLSRGFNLQYFAGGDFREADIENGKVVRKGWYIHPKTGQRIETDF